MVKGKSGVMRGSRLKSRREFYFGSWGCLDQVEKDWSWVMRGFRFKSQHEHKNKNSIKKKEENFILVNSLYIYRILSEVTRSLVRYGVFFNLVGTITADSRGGHNDTDTRTHLYA